MKKQREQKPDVRQNTTKREKNAPKEKQCGDKKHENTGTLLTTPAEIQQEQKHYKQEMQQTAKEFTGAPCLAHLKMKMNLLVHADLVLVPIGYGSRYIELYRPTKLHNATF